MRSHSPLIGGLLAVVFASPLSAQWTNRYPKVDGFGHHVYLEGYELPTLSHGPIDPAPAPDGRAVAFASRGWIWVVDAPGERARRVTRGSGLDARPAWSPDGRSIAFTRDDTRDIDIVLLDLATGAERVIVDEPALDLDPAFSHDGRFLYYASAVAGDLDLWRVDVATGARERLTEQRGLELKPSPHPDGERIVYLSKAGGSDEVRVRVLATGEERVLVTGRITSQTRPALSPDGRTVAYNWPDEDGWELRLLDVARPGSTIRLTRGSGLPLTPAWSPDGAWVWFSEAASDETMRLRRVASVGGDFADVAVSGWDWGAPTGRLRITTRLVGASPVAARLSVLDADGHPAIARGQSFFDGQNGMVFFYSPGTIEVEVPAGEVMVAAVRGLATPVATARQTVRAGETATVALDLSPVWDPRADGWTSGDHHFHLNYGGPYRLEPDDLAPFAAGEDVDVLTPLVANLHDRWEDDEFFGWRGATAWPLIRFGQEVRPHFLGHTGHVGIDELFWPWIWGPGYQVYGEDDRTSATALAHTRRGGGVAAYVHPVSGRSRPFADDRLGAIPVEFVPDAVLGMLDAIELVCLWSDELGSSDLWYRILNLGIPLALTAGTDVMTNFHRTMAVGTTRIYVRAGDAPSLESYLAALRAGRSFVTTGPLLDFRVGGARPGDATGPTRTAEWTLDLHTAVPVDSVQVLVNGQVVWSGGGVADGGSRTFAGDVALPEGGWVAARAIGGATEAWPAMDSYGFAHTSPVWIGEVGSRDPAAERTAARELLRALDVAEQRLAAGYEGVDIPRLREHFARARAELERRAGPGT